MENPINYLHLFKLIQSPQFQLVMKKLPDPYIGIFLMFVGAYEEERLKQMVDAQIRLLKEAEENMDEEQFDQFLKGVRKFYDEAQKMDDYINRILVQGFTLYNRRK